MSPSISRNTSSWLQNDSSTSIWVNSGWRSSAQILVAEALDDLEVAVEARDHEQLLEELRALGQGVELARRAGARARGSCARRRRVYLTMNGVSSSRQPCSER